MKLPTEIFGEVVVVHTPDELTHEQLPQFGDWLASLERSCVVVDMDATETIDSCSLEAMLVAQEKLQPLGGDIRIYTANTNNRKILEMTRLDQQLEVYPTVLDAVKSFA